MPDESEKFDEAWVSEKLKELGFEKLQLMSDGVKSLIESLNNKETSNGKFCVAKKSDAIIKVLVAKDKMSAYLTIKPPKGGKRASLDMVKRVLAEKGIRYGFIPEAIKSAILKGAAKEKCIAKGAPVINGTDAKFTCLLPEVKIRTPKVTENGNVDYRDLGEILIVHQGEPLMRRTPSTAGKASKNIYGEIINPKPGKDLKYAQGLDGVRTDENDPNLLIAATTGQPVIVENGVSVEDTMSVKEVSLKTGNIEFDGSVIITGDVENNMKVIASGDINVKGMVEGGQLEAGGDVIVDGAIIGRGDVRDKKGNFNDETAVVHAKGSVSAKFVENSFVEAENNIYIQDWVIKSELNAINEIIIGNKNAKKGQIIGGRIKSGILIKAMNIGSQAGVQTDVKVGTTMDIEKEMNLLSKDITNQSRALKELNKTMTSLKNNPTNQAKEMLKKVLQTKVFMEQELIDLRARKILLDKEQKRLDNAKIVVETTIYTGTQISVGHFRKEIKEDVGARSFTIIEGKIAQIS